MLHNSGIEDFEIEDAYTLVMKESSCRINAENPESGAYGLPQSLPAEKMASMGGDWRTNPNTQLKWMKDYVYKRYGGFNQALQFHLSNNWY